MSKAHFRPSLFAFLTELKLNNDRAWFAANKQRYERDVREPMLQFITDFAGPLAGVSKQFLADPRPVGGSMFRIYRDTRFSRDKSPYKPYASAQFRHRRGRDVHAPGFYLHLEPGGVFAGAGIWHPDAKTLAPIRKAVAGKSADWKKAIGGKAFRASCSLEGDALKRPPRGFDAEHPLIEDLKRKDFIAVTRWSERDVMAPDFLKRMVAFCRATTPFTRFLTTALKLPF